HKYLL
ncbi:hypothetical protein D039_4284B, partial [Vibrio parahaemolyticus EKP-028]